MEIRKYEDIHGLTAAQDIVEGRFVIINSDGKAALPNGGSEVAHLLAGHPVSNINPPFYLPNPTYTFGLRKTFEQAPNVPFATTVHLTNLSMTESPTIPSGSGILLFDGGVFTLPSGQWVYSAGVVPGVELEVVNSGATAGKPQLKSSGTAVAMVLEVGTDETLTFKAYGL
jgi:hypothetical protein